MASQKRPRPRTKLRRMPERAVNDREPINEILDEAVVSHLGIVDDSGFPVVIPTTHARIGDDLYIHGSAASRTLKRAAKSEICLTVTLLDGLILARSALNHDVTYRSVVVFGEPELLRGPEAKREALHAFTEKLVPGRWDEVREPTDRELKMTAVMRMPLDEVSAKVRTGGPKDVDEDYELPVWAGVVGLHMTAGAPEPDDRLLPDVECPAHVTALDTHGARWRGR